MRHNQSVEGRRQMHGVCSHPWTAMPCRPCLPWRHLPCGGRCAGDVTGNSDWRTVCAHAQWQSNDRVSDASPPRNFKSGRQEAWRRIVTTATTLHNCWPARITWPQHVTADSRVFCFSDVVAMTSRLLQLAWISVISIFRHADVSLSARTAREFSDVRRRKI